MLRVDPAARGRLAEIIKNLADRIAEARINGWLGEVEGLQVSLTAARAKLATLGRTARNTALGAADLGARLPHRQPRSQAMTIRPRARSRSIPQGHGRPRVPQHPAPARHRRRVREARGR